MVDDGRNTAAVSTRLTVGELLRLYPRHERITGWDPSNPPAVEKAFRTGYVIGVRRFIEARAFGFVHDEPCDPELAAGLAEHLDRRRGEQYDCDRSSDRRAALLRGCEHGLLDAVRARAAGVSPPMLVDWLDELRDWAAEDPPCLEWEHAMPPDAPEPDGSPWERDGVPRKLWADPFGMWAVFAPQAEPPPRPLGNLERILHPDPAVRRTATSEKSANQPAEVPANRWPEPKAIAEFGRAQSLEWVWEGWVAIAHITALVAKWKAGKTTLLHHLLCARERGGDIAGTIAAGSTLVISEEHPTLWRKRSAGKRIGEHVKFICLPLITSIRDWFEFTEHVANLVVRDGYTLVVYDTLPGLAPIQDENANSQMRAFLRPLLRLKDIGTGTLLITHPPKGHTGDDFNVRGASALMGFADPLVALKRPAGDTDTTRRILKCVGRLGEPLEQTIELRGSEYVTLGTQLDIERAGRRAALQAILPAEPPGLTVEEIVTRWPADEKVPAAKTLRRHLADWLNKDGAESKDDPVRYWW